MRIGIFGGTFDPPHLGHLTLSHAAQSQLNLDRLLWVLTPHPPHKRGLPITPLVHRLHMVELALQSEPFELSRIEIDRPPPHYALDTVRLMAEQYPHSDLIYLMGSDSLNDLPSWHRPLELLAALHGLGIMPRPGSMLDISSLENQLPGLTEKLRLVEAPPVEISSSDIRRRIRQGEPFEHLVPPAVAEYIHRYQLYRATPER
ncbi:MAG: nicotinate (nicotinamide) nucleotide adenylyltransferase [Anaerolineales bacterium]|nr:nicotinate (nicotinamide) nucleotide adenylyltransferase [Anaerolineales bacterium]